MQNIRGSKVFYSIQGNFEITPSVKDISYYPQESTDWCMKNFSRRKKSQKQKLAEVAMVMKAHQLRKSQCKPQLSDLNFSSFAS